MIYSMLSIVDKAINIICVNFRMWDKDKRQQKVQEKSMKRKEKFAIIPNCLV